MRTGADHDGSAVARFCVVRGEGGNTTTAGPPPPGPPARRRASTRREAGWADWGEGGRPATRLLPRNHAAAAGTPASDRRAAGAPHLVRRDAGPQFVRGCGGPPPPACRRVGRRIGRGTPSASARVASASWPAELDAAVVCQRVEIVDVAPCVQRGERLQCALCVGRRVYRDRAKCIEAVLFLRGRRNTKPPQDGGGDAGEVGAGGCRHDEAAGGGGGGGRSLLGAVRAGGALPWI